jgi:hypothetical protein
MGYHTRAVTIGKDTDMKKLTLVAVFCFASPIVAQNPSQPASQQPTARVLGIGTHKTHSIDSYIDPQSSCSGKPQVHDADASWTQRVTVIQIAKLVYESPQIYKEVQDGADYPVTIESDKHGVPKKLILTVGNKTFKYSIARTREAKSN